MLAAVLTLALAAPTLASDSCCASASAPEEAQSTSQRISGVGAEAGAEAGDAAGCSDSAKPSCCFGDELKVSKPKRSEGCCPERARWARRPFERQLFVGVRGGALKAGKEGPSAATFGLTIRRTFTRRLSAGFALDQTRMADSFTAWSLATPVRLRLLGRCVQFYAEAGPAIRTSYSAQQDGGTYANASPGYQAALGISVFAPLGLRADVAYVADGSLSARGALQVAGAARPARTLVGARLGISKAI